MKQTFLRASLGLLLGAATITARPALAADVVELKQPNAAKVVVMLRFQNGSASDPKGKEGLAYLTSQLVTEGGTKELTASQLKDKLYPMAVRYGARTDKEVTTFTFEFHRDFLDQFYPVLKGLMLTPSFTPEDFARLKSNQLNYVEQVIRASSDEDYSKFALEDQLFRGTRYQHMTRGTAAGVQSLTLDDVKKFYAAAYGKNNLTIGLSGNYPESFVQKLKKDMDALPTATVKPDVPKAAAPKGVQVEIVSKPDALGSAVYAGFPIETTRAKDDFAALMVANSFLGEHRKSYGKLYDKIRTARSMNYGDYSYIEWYEAGGNNMLPVPGVPRHANYASIWIRPVQIAEGLRKQYPAELGDLKVGQAPFALRLALREMDGLVKNGMSKEDFELTRTFLRSYTKLYGLTSAKQLGFLLDSKFYGRKDWLQELDGQLAKLTLDDVNKAIKKYWQVQNMYVTIVTDDSEAQPLAEVLKTNTASPMSYAKVVREGLPKEILAEDEQVATYKLNVTNVKVVDTKDTFK
ncbi:insulinase family protein [Hymenobacter sp. 15J16-1T3B]|uniref:M16 family metallopeptidase n=1 Tax=Hymenobacter sp. 15J16-1T3B TaxID=2886941 RepID=UPI001D128F0F|nr:pitrilysin family protein [Hymenobacter sp. 15J16-1T3B]MCC3158330.1 insulinase family protein [Hymenobacter sp. 15J16-1T3B]